MATATMRSSYSVVALKRWSCKSKEIASPSAIKAIHVYDFDNTLFSSPLPNPQVWSPPTVGMLQAYETFAFGGWWHDPSILAATGQGIEKEEPRAWQGCWNETAVQLAEMSMQAKDVLTVLLTGRGETDFADLVTRICGARGLDFDLVVLKPEVGPAGQRCEATMVFKQEFLKDLVCTYKHADEIRIYEDRTKYVKAFREFFDRLNKSLLSHPADEPPPPRKPITAEVIHVCELKTYLSPETEVEVVHKAIERHNHAVAAGGPNPTRSTRKQLRIVDHFSYFGYLIGQTDAARLITLCNSPPHLIDSGEVRLLASSILIAPFYPRKDILAKVGGRGRKVTWQVTGIAKFEDRIWAARVAPVSDTPVYTQDPTPLVVLAIRKGSRQVDAARIQNWQPVPPDKAFMFETTVGDKTMLRIEDDDGLPTRDGRRGGRAPASYEPGHKRKQGPEDTGYRPKDHYAAAGAGGGRENGVWSARRGGALGGRFAQRNALSKAQFNNRNNPNLPGARGPGGGAGPNFTPRQGPAVAGNAATGGTRRPPGGPGAPRGPGGGYRSLDDYGPASFDGTQDVKTAPGEMVMNY